MPALTRHNLSRGHLWALVILALGLIAGHGLMLYYASSHMALSAGIVTGIVLIAVIKHLGLLGPAFALFRRHRPKR